MAEEDGSPVCGEDISQPYPLDPRDSTEDTRGYESAEYEPKTSERDPKEDVIVDACRRRDIAALQSLAMSTGGFVNDELRQQACELQALANFFLAPSTCCRNSAATFCREIEEERKTERTSRISH